MKQRILKLRRRIALFLVENKATRPVIDQIIKLPLPDYKALRWFVSGFGFAITLNCIHDRVFFEAFLAFIITAFLWLLPSDQNKTDDNDEDDDFDGPNDPDMPNGNAVDRWLREKQKAKRGKA